jgi:hypothetical protein
VQVEFTLSTLPILAGIQEFEELSSCCTLKSKQKGGSAADDIVNKATSPFRDEAA